MKILLDNGILIHSEFAEDAVIPTIVHWGGTTETRSVHGLMRKKPDEDTENQSQKNALFTVCRLIREGRIQAYDYIEIRFEGMRSSAPIQQFNALQNCQIHRCPTPVERSRFRQTIDFMEAISKGGKKDRKAGAGLGMANQIPFFEWLCNLRKEDVNSIIKHAAAIGLLPFEVESLENIGWFQFVCRRSGSPENYPDVFHLWTAERNGLDAVLTLEKRLPNLISRINNERIKKIKIQTEVLRPLELLRKLGINQLDPVPMAPDRFYNYWGL